MQSHEAKRQRVEKPRASSENVMPFPSTSVAETNDADERYDADANNSPSRHTPGRTPGTRRLHRTLDRSHPVSRLDDSIARGTARRRARAASWHESESHHLSAAGAHIFLATLSSSAPVADRRSPTLAARVRQGLTSSATDHLATSASSPRSETGAHATPRARFRESPNRGTFPPCLKTQIPSRARATSPLADAHADSTTYPLIDHAGSNAINPNSRRRPRTGMRAGMTF